MEEVEVRRYRGLQSANRDMAVLLEEDQEEVHTPRGKEEDRWGEHIPRELVEGQLVECIRYWRR